MLKISVPVSLVSVKAAKDAKSNNYADFLFIGGSISVPVDQGVFDLLKPKEGAELLASFQVRPVQVVRFGRPVSMFEPIKFLGIDE